MHFSLPHVMNFWLFLSHNNHTFGCFCFVNPAECGCSCQNRIKNRKLSRLSEKYVEILMLISMEGPDDESMDLNRARQLFKRTGEFNLSRLNI